MNTFLGLDSDFGAGWGEVVLTAFRQGVYIIQWPMAVSTDLVLILLENDNRRSTCILPRWDVCCACIYHRQSVEILGCFGFPTVHSMEITQQTDFQARTGEPSYSSAGYGHKSL